MAFPNEQLFLDRFIAYNQDRYKDEPDFVTVLGTLTLGNALFTNFRKSTNAGVISYLVDVDAPDKFIGVDQKYTPADYIKQEVCTLIEPGALTLANLQIKRVQGIYLLSGEGGSNTGVVLVPQGQKTATVVRGLVKAGCLYNLTDAQVTINAGVTTVTIDSRTVVGSLTVVEMADPIHDGTYLHDGTLTYQ